MSTDAHGILYYGIEFGDELPRGLDEHDANDAWQKEHRPLQPKNKDNYRTPEWDEWRERLRAWEQTSENIEIAFSGSDAVPNYYVHCRPCERKVEWAQQIELDPATLVSPVDADEKIAAFCERFGLPYKQPSWHLASLYF